MLPQPSSGKTQDPSSPQKDFVSRQFPNLPWPLPPLPRPRLGARLEGEAGREATPRRRPSFQRWAWRGRAGVGWGVVGHSIPSPPRGLGPAWPRSRSRSRPRPPMHDAATDPPTPSFAAAGAPRPFPPAVSSATQTLDPGRGPHWAPAASPPHLAAPASRRPRSKWCSDATVLQLPPPSQGLRGPRKEVAFIDDPSPIRHDHKMMGHDTPGGDEGLAKSLCRVARGRDEALHRTARRGLPCGPTRPGHGPHCPWPLQ